MKPKEVPKKDDLLERVKQDKAEWKQFKSQTIEKSSFIEQPPKNGKNKSQKKFAWALIAVILISFLLWSAYSNTQQSFPNSLPSNTTEPNSTPSQPPTTEPDITTEPNSIQKSNTQKYSYEELVDYTLSLINSDRQTHGLKNVTLSDVDSGQQHAENMLENCYLSHWDTNGYKPYLRYTLVDGQGSVSENCAWMYNSNGLDPKQAIKELQYDMVYDDASSDWGHRDNTLDPLHNKVSIGIAYSNTDLYLVQDFEDDYISWTTLTLSRQVIMNGTFLEENQTISQVDIYYDDPKTLTPQQLNNYPYASSYSAGMCAGMAFLKDPNSIYLPNGVSCYDDDGVWHFVFPELISADIWENGIGDFSVQFNMTDVFSEYGIGVYTLYLWTESNECLTSLSFWWDGSK